MVSLLYKYTEGKCRAFEGEVPPDHDLAAPAQLLQVGSSWYIDGRAIHGLLSTFACSYVHLPSEELNRRLMPSDAGVRSLGASIVNRASSRRVQEEKGEGKEGEGEKDGKDGEKSSSSSSKDKKGGKKGSSSSKAGKDSKAGTGTTSKADPIKGDSKGGKGEEVGEGGEKGSSSSKAGKHSKAEKSSSSSSTKGHLEEKEAASSKGGNNSGIGEGEGEDGKKGSSSSSNAGNEIKAEKSSSSINEHQETEAAISKGGQDGRGNNGASSSSSSGGGSSKASDEGKVEKGSSSSSSNSDGASGGDSLSKDKKGGMGSSSDAAATVASTSGDGKGDVAAGSSSSTEKGPTEQGSSLGGSGGEGLEEDESDASDEESYEDYNGVPSADLPGGLNPSTLWEIAAQNTAVAAAYAKKVKAEKAAAEKRGEEPEEARPFRFTWPGKPFDDVFAHWVFTNLPVGSVKTPPPPNYPSATLGGVPTALHVQLIIELLLLCWPDPQVPYVAVTTAEGEVSPTEFVAGLRWDWLLLLMALLQQTSTEDKQQVLRERGPLLMQLLYHVLLEDEGLGAEKADASALVTTSGETAWYSWFLAVTIGGEGNYSQIPGKISWAASVPMAVTMVLQNLLFESLPEAWVDPKTARIGKVLTSPLRKCIWWGEWGGGMGGGEVWAAGGDIGYPCCLRILGLARSLPAPFVSVLGGGWG